MNAIYGKFSIDMLPVETINVTEKIDEFLKGNIIEIPQDINFDTLFDKVGNNKRSYLQISVNDQVFNIAEDEYIENIELDLLKKVNSIKIVYYIYTSPNSNWRAIVSGQLYQLKSYGILSEADLYIHITDSNNYIDEIKTLIINIVPAAIISTSSINQFEYPAIKLLHDLAIQYPNNNFIYFHSKGMTHSLHSRSLQEIMLLTKTFENWRKNLQLLSKEGKNKMGLFSAERGWIWYNFWYAKGSYLANCKAPEISDFRYYYEAWLGEADPDQQIPATDCINLFEIKNVSKPYFTPVEADIYKENLMEKLFSHAESKEFRVVRTSFMIYCQLKVDSFFKLFKKSNLKKVFN
ncbi:hypothetical protein SNE25_01790 [Mucilaginibacter sabulilitoris]|uniref:Uncharacterized protein n=1 Tax=Mucilaginibacter sabulilitoris TaxID=1173583 RepID=A0ABZ0TM63_9SPHI|nr:hypothetical protein [Mucilaginibacter sabulilitoris]WPU94256.1 hypothetical protein SNE25_01790 [Mucilaginibacter sabulilitoris]